ncbi:Immunoglobulin E-set [Paramicrosporidium saccamoebae]|uniref:Immunoglobulin E-set n=1 Tax=Paramicrosporidium saccamoebae TaxID=1246581 RepID=A0A2H9TQ62_9FUNG|nr:Immunoglobulin E-set [Paramicrosporidium saccamoebae]
MAHDQPRPLFWPRGPEENMAGRLRDGLRVRVETEKAQYTAGEEIVGAAVLIATLPIKHEGVHLRLGCVIRVHAHAADAGREYLLKTRRYLENSEQTALSKGVLAPGEYTLPFRWKIPVNAPASFIKTSPPNTAYVKHRVKVCVRSASFFPRDSFYDHVFRVYRLHVPDQAHAQMSHPVNKYCCMRSGDVTMLLSLQTNTILPGKTITAVIRLDASQCMLTSAPVLLQLKQQIEYHVRNEKFVISTVMSKWVGNALVAGEVLEKTVDLATPADLECSVSAYELHCRYFLTATLGYGIVQKKEVSVEVIVGALRGDSTKSHALPPIVDKGPPPQAPDSE